MCVCVCTRRATSVTVNDDFDSYCLLMSCSERVLDAVVFATALHVELTLVGFHSGSYILMLLSFSCWHAPQFRKPNTPRPTHIHRSWIHNPWHIRQEASCIVDCQVRIFLPGEEEGWCLQLSAAGVDPDRQIQCKNSFPLSKFDSRFFMYEISELSYLNLEAARRGAHSHTRRPKYSHMHSLSDY